MEWVVQIYILSTLFRKDAHIHKVINTVSAIRSVNTLKENLSRIFRRGNRLSKRKSNEEYDKVILTSNNLVNKFLISTVWCSKQKKCSEIPNPIPLIAYGAASI